MQILNPIAYGDYHTHSSNYSDGFNTIDEIVLKAGELGYEEIAITDHSQALLDAYGIAKKTHYEVISGGRWENIYNDVNVIFGVEADLLDGEGNICRDIQGKVPDFVLLSTHKKVFRDSLQQLKKGYLNAIERYGDSIDCLGHLCIKPLTEGLKPAYITEIVEAASKKDIAVELNCSNLAYGKTDLDNLEAMLSACDKLYVNSDAHTMNELISIRQKGFDYLERRIK